MTWKMRLKDAAEDALWAQAGEWKAGFIAGMKLAATFHPDVSQVTIQDSTGTPLVTVARQTSWSAV